MTSPPPFPLADILYLLLIFSCAGSSLPCEAPPQWQRAGAALCWGPRASRGARALERPGSVAVAARLHVASGHVGIFLDQGSNPCLLHRWWTLNHCTAREALGDTWLLSPSISLLCSLSSAGRLCPQWQLLSREHPRYILCTVERATRPGRCLKPTASPVPGGCRADPAPRLPLHTPFPLPGRRFLPRLPLVLPAHVQPSNSLS